MKASIIALFVVASLTSSAQKWEFQRDYQLNYLAVSFSDNSNVFAVGRGRMVTGSSDGGDSWNRIQLDTFNSPNYLEGLHFINSQIGYAIGANWLGSSVFKTTNGGNSWQGIDKGGDSRFIVANGIYMSADKIGFFSDDFGALATTKDDFKTSKKALYVAMDPNKPKLEWSFSTYDTGFVFFNSTKEIYSSYDGGVTFSHVSSSDSIILNNIVTINSRTIVGMSDIGCFISKNGGKNWAALKGDSVVTSDLLAGAYSRKRNLVYACGRHGILAHIDLVRGEVLRDTIVPFNKEDGGFVDIALSPDEATCVAVGTGGRMARFFDPKIEIDEEGLKEDMAITLDRRELRVKSLNGAHFDEYSLLGLDGRVLVHGRAFTDNFIRIDLSKYAMSTYIVRVKTSHGLLTRKIVVF